jgi:FMN phosphatase YigB (HAD superfamily)
MKFRAIIFDIYKTLLEVGPPPADADRQWKELWREHFRSDPRLRLNQFNTACDQIIEREHGTARAVGIQFPEVYWPDIVGEVLPEFSRLEMSLRRAFMRGHKRLTHTVTLFREAVGLLRRLHERDIVLGLVSNSQPYTLPELESEFAPAGLSAAIFHPSLRFLSFEHGFSKPDPHVFRLLAARLRTMGIQTKESLIVGDRPDNDIEPAKSHGFQTWQMAPAHIAGGGDWKHLAAFLEQ